MKPLRVGVLCEFSGVVRDAFRARGHDAVSCDLLPSEAPGPHIQGDCLAQDWTGFDLIVAHPPCTYLSRAGARWWKAPGRSELAGQAAEFVFSIRDLPVDRIAIENPIGQLNQRWRMDEVRFDSSQGLHDRGVAVPDELLTHLPVADYERARACVNALAGCPDPERAVGVAREAIRVALGELEAYRDNPHGHSPLGCVSRLRSALALLGATKP